MSGFNSQDYYESEARAERRENRRKEEERFVPLPNRKTSKGVAPENRVDIESDWTPQPGSYACAALYIERHVPGFYVWGHASVAQLRELRDALNAHISQVLEEHDD